jgi:hypothetical protein
LIHVREINLVGFLKPDLVELPSFAFLIVVLPVFLISTRRLTLADRAISRYTLVVCLTQRWCWTNSAALFCLQPLHLELLRPSVENIPGRQGPLYQLVQDRV